MNLDAIHRHGLWYANAEGDVVPANDTGDGPPVETHSYACVRFPLQILTEHYRRREGDGGYGGNDRIMHGTSSANAELVLAMAMNPTPHGPISLHDALILASEVCGRCLNALAFEYGLSWGYPEGGEEWARTGTSCKACE